MTNEQETEKVKRPQELIEVLEKDRRGLGRDYSRDFEKMEMKHSSKCALEYAYEYATSPQVSSPEFIRSLFVIYTNANLDGCQLPTP